MNILVTGASGFLGRHLCKQLKANGHSIVEVSSKIADLRKVGTLDQFSSTKFDRIYHLAAWTQAGDFCLSHPGEQWLINQAINTNVIEWWHRTQPHAKIIVTGTSCSYSPDLPLKEENYLVGEPIEGLYTYAHTKRMLLIGLKALHKQFGGSYLYVVPSTLYGPDYHTDGRQLHFIFDLIRKIIAGKEQGSPVVLWGDGHQKRELVLVDDFSRIMFELDRSVSNEVINIGAGEEYSIREFAGLICEYVGYDSSKIQYDTSKYVGAKSKCLDVRKLKQLLPNSKVTPLNVGLKRTVEWFVENKKAFLSGGKP